MSLFLLLHYFVRIRYIISGEEVSSPITDIYTGNRKYSIFHSFLAKRFATPSNAYYLGVTTQQWSVDIKEILTRTLRNKQRFFNLTKSGKKTFKVRVGYDTIDHIQSGE